MECVAAWPGLAGRLLQLVAELVALLVDGGDHRPGRQAQADERRFRKLQAGLDGLRHGVGDADRIEMAGVRGVAGARDDEDVGSQRARHAHDLVDRRLVVDGDDDGRRLHAGRSSSGTRGWWHRRSRPRARAGDTRSRRPGSRSVAMKGKRCRSSMSHTICPTRPWPTTMAWPLPPAGGADGQLRLEGLARLEPAASGAARNGQQRDQHHRQRGHRQREAATLAPPRARAPSPRR